MYLVICEKPSVAQSIAKVIGAYKSEDGYLSGRDCIVSWCLGHLAEYAMPEAYDEKYKKWNFNDLPIIPENWKLEVARDKAKQFHVLKKLLSGSLVPVEYVVNACDAGREGESIFMRVYTLSRSRLPVKRLWISSMEDSAILDGFHNLRDGSEYHDLYQASVCRAQADWLIGMNASRAYTKTYEYRMTVGRVQTPTLAMLVNRQEEIDGFVKQRYYMTHLLTEGVDAVSEHLPDAEEAEQIAQACRGKTARVISVMKEEKSLVPPRLYDLTTLQREANRLFGFTAKQTLEYAQNLYEEKLLTYPRTDSQYLTDDMEETAGEMVEMLKASLPYLDEETDGYDLSHTLNSEKVSDHHAIIPTSEFAQADLSDLSEGERKILLMAANRLICAVGKKHRYLSVKAEIECSGYSFRASGKTILENGWKAYEEALKGYLRAEDNKKEKEPDSLPDLYEGQMLRETDTKVTEHWTKPPAPYTEDSLLAAIEHAGSAEMEDDVERKGLGTPATRASIIEKLISGGYAFRKKKQVLPTEAGSKMIALMPEYLKSAQMTADWENRLLMMERGQASAEGFMEDIKDLIGTILKDCREIPETERRQFISEAGSYSSDEVGKCPVCGNPVREGKKNFFCVNRDCSFALWKENRYLANMKKRIDKRMAAELLSTGKTHADDFYSVKTGKAFQADLLMDVSGDGKTSFHLEFPARHVKRKKR